MLKIDKYSDYKFLLNSSKTIAVVGLSPKEARPSNMVARYLMSVGYTIIPVNPGQSDILGCFCYGSLLDIPVKVDIVNIFRRSADVYPVVQDAIAIGAKAVWMQQGISHVEAQDLALANGLEVIADRCIKVDHMQLFPH